MWKWRIYLLKTFADFGNVPAIVPSNKLDLSLSIILFVPLFLTHKH